MRGDSDPEGGRNPQLLPQLGVRSSAEDLSLLSKCPRFRKKNKTKLKICLLFQIRRREHLQIKKSPFNLCPYVCKIMTASISFLALDENFSWQRISKSFNFKHTKMRHGRIKVLHSLCYGNGD